MHRQAYRNGSTPIFKGDAYPTHIQLQISMDSCSHFRHVDRLLFLKYFQIALTVYHIFFQMSTEKIKFLSTVGLLPRFFQSIQQNVHQHQHCHGAAEDEIHHRFRNGVSEEIDSAI